MDGCGGLVMMAAIDPNALCKSGGGLIRVVACSGGLVTHLQFAIYRILSSEHNSNIFSSQYYVQLVLRTFQDRRELSSILSADTAKCCPSVCDSLAVADPAIPARASQPGPAISARIRPGILIVAAARPAQ